MINGLKFCIERFSFWNLNGWKTTLLIQSTELRIWPSSSKPSDHTPTKTVFSVHVYISWQVYCFHVYMDSIFYSKAHKSTHFVKSCGLCMHSTCTLLYKTPLFSFYNFFITGTCMTNELKIKPMSCGLFFYWLKVKNVEKK